MRHFIALCVLLGSLSAPAQHREKDYPSKRKAEKLTMALKEDALTKATRYIEEGKTYFNKRQLASALESFTNGIDIEPVDEVKHFGNRYGSRPPYQPLKGELLKNRGITYLAMGKYGDAKQDFRTAYYKHRQKDLELHVGYAETLKALGDHSGAYMQYSHARKLSPDNVALTYGQAITGYYACYIKMRNTMSAWYGETLRRDGNNRFDNPIYLFTEVIKLKPNHSFAYAGRALAKLEAGREFSALADVEKAVELSPNNAEFHFVQGLIQHKGYEKTDEAVVCLKRAIELDPSNPKYPNAIALWKKETQSREDADAIFNAVAGLVMMAVVNHVLNGDPLPYDPDLEDRVNADIQRSNEKIQKLQVDCMQGMGMKGAFLMQ